MYFLLNIFGICVVALFFLLIGAWIAVRIITMDNHLNLIDW